MKALGACLFCALHRNIDAAMKDGSIGHPIIESTYVAFGVLDATMVYGQQEILTTMYAGHRKLFLERRNEVHTKLYPDEAQS